MLKSNVLYLRLIIFFVLLCSSVSFCYSSEVFVSKVEAQEQNLLLIKERPRLYLTLEKIKFIKSRLNKYPYSKFWKYIKKRANKYAKESPPITINIYNDIRGFGSRLPYMAMAYLLTSNKLNKLYLKGVKKWMNALCSYPNWASNEDLGAAHILFGMSICYDWLYDKFTPEERALYRKKITKHANILYNLLVSRKKWWAKTYLQNHNYTNVMSIALAGLALYGEVEKAKAWIAAAKENFKRVLYWLSPDGATYEGVGYWSYGTEALLKYFMAMAPIYGLDEVKNSSFFQKTAYYRLHMSLPDFKDNVNYADSPYFEWYGPGYILRCLASIFNDGHVQWLADRIESARGRRANYSWLDLIWYNEKIKPIPPDNLPTYAYFENLGIFVRRTSWSPNAVWIFFKAGPPMGKKACEERFYRGAGHVHPDEGNFLLWAYGKWLIVDNGYSILKNTVNHNVFLFNGQGQLGEGRKWFNMGEVRKYKGFARIVYLDLKPDYQYIVGDISKIYPPKAGLKKWLRTIVVLPKGYLLVRDDIELKDFGYAENNIHLGLGYIRKIKRDFLYKEYNLGLYIHELYGSAEKQVVPTVFIGERFKKDVISRFTLKLHYAKKYICSILLFRPWHDSFKPGELTVLNNSKNTVEFYDKFMSVKINFLTKQIKILNKN